MRFEEKDELPSLWRVPDHVSYNTGKGDDLMSISYQVYTHTHNINQEPSFGMVVTSLLLLHDFQVESVIRICRVQLCRAIGVLLLCSGICIISQASS